MRLMFMDNLDEPEVGTRTKKIVEMVAEKISTLQEATEEQALELAERIINKAGVTTKDQEAKALFFMSSRQAMNLAELAVSVENIDDISKKDAQLALVKGHGIDIALFGRMVADDPSLNEDASSQVAHAISTHRVDNEYDYFTAVDDRAPEDNAGAGMIGTIEFNSATFYRYATIAVHELFTQLSEDAKTTSRAVSEFVKAFITSMPTGKQNTFANRTPADAVLVCLRNDQPVNLVGAFEEAVSIGLNDIGYVKPSIRSLSNHFRQVNSTFVDTPAQCWSVGSDFEGLTDPTNLAVMVSSIKNILEEALGAPNESGL
jgi:CRISPR system Cascade subunit CasC